MKLHHSSQHPVALISQTRLWASVALICASAWALSGCKGTESTGDGSDGDDTPTAPTEGLVAHFRFEEPLSSMLTYDEVADLSAEVRNLSSGTPPTIESEGGKGFLKVPGVRYTSVKVTNNAAFHSSSTLTISTWMSLEDDSACTHCDTNMIFSQYRTNSSNSTTLAHRALSYDRDVNRFRFFFTDSMGTTFQYVYNLSSGIPLDTWVHVALRITASTVDVFYNGALVKSETFTSDGTGVMGSIDPASNHGKLHLGSWKNHIDDQDYLSGSLDELRWYSRALSDAEIGDLYRVGR